MIFRGSCPQQMLRPPIFEQPRKQPKQAKRRSAGIAGNGASGHYKNAPASATGAVCSPPEVAEVLHTEADSGLGFDAEVGPSSAPKIVSISLSLRQPNSLLVSRFVTVRSAPCGQGPVSLDEVSPRPLLETNSLVRKASRFLILYDCSVDNAPQRQRTNADHEMEHNRCSRVGFVTSRSK